LRSKVNKLILGFFIFTGSVFLTSSKFVSATNTSKFYFVLVSLLAMVLVHAMRFKQIKPIKALDRKAFFYGIFFVSFLQACYGLCQFLSFFPSNNPNFEVTGSFDNPAGFASVLAIGFP